MIGDCVVDASVGIKLFLAEPGSEKADALFEQLTAPLPATLYVPDLFYIECTNILWKYARHFGYPPDQAQQNIIDLQALRLQTISTADLVKPALKLALTYNLTAYDACYAALSETLNVPLVTADAPMARKLANSHIDVRQLADL